MKNIVIAASLLFFIGFQSCKEAETTNPNQDPANDGIVGVWNFVRADQDNGVITTDGIQYATYYSRSSDPQGTYKMFEDGTFESNTGYVNTLTMDLFGNPFESISTIPLTKITGTYEYDESTQELHITNNGFSGVYEILEFTDTKLLMKTSIKKTETQGMSTSVTTADVTLELAR